MHPYSPLLILEQTKMLMENQTGKLLFIFIEAS
jgi:hypothetical protein